MILFLKLRSIIRGRRFFKRNERAIYRPIVSIKEDKKPTLAECIELERLYIIHLKKVGGAKNMSISLMQDFLKENGFYVQAFPMSE